MSVFKELNGLNVNDKTEKKQKLTYLSWAWAWAKVKEKYPLATYKVWKDEKGSPYTFNETLGYMCYTTVTIEEETLEMWLPVMNGANKAMLNAPYTYEVKIWKSEEVEIKHVLAATMFDINKTIMRCLVKNLAMFGLGLYIYAGEDLPEQEPITPTKDSVLEIIDNAIDNSTLTEWKAWIKKFGLDGVAKDKSESFTNKLKK